MGFRAGDTGRHTRIVRNPRISQTLSQGSIVVPLQPSPRPLRVLVADDNLAIVEMAALLLRLDGYEVETAMSGGEALDAAQRTRPDVIFLDIGMPGLDGWEVARRLREEGGPHRPTLVAITAYGAEEDVARSRDAGFDLHLVKPADPVVILKLLRDRAAQLFRP